MRQVWASLQNKPYGRNGITAEDPPLRLRFRRFLRSWEYALEHHVPVLKFEHFVQQAETELKKLCVALDLPWHQDMLEWPKAAEAISDTRHGNAAFRAAPKNNLHTALNPEILHRPLAPMHQQDLAWLDEQFAQYNQMLGYPAQLDTINTLPGRAEPDWALSRRRAWRLRQKPWRYLLHKLGLSRYQPRPQ